MASKCRQCGSDDTEFVGNLVSAASAMHFAHSLPRYVEDVAKYVCNKCGEIFEVKE